MAGEEDHHDEQEEHGGKDFSLHSLSVGNFLKSLKYQADITGLL